MEAYPPQYCEHDLPLIFLSGLGQDAEKRQRSDTTPNVRAGITITLASPECQGRQVEQLLGRLLQNDGIDLSWNSRILPGPSGNLKFTMKAIGRTLSLPPRKAAPMPQSPSADGFDAQQSISQRNAELHSPLSPLSPGSPLFPDGVFTPIWLSKHQRQVPAFVLAFFHFSATSSANDDQIKVDINACRTGLSRSGFKSRFAAVLIGDETILKAPSLEDRLASIKRATSLDLKTGLFFMPPMSSEAEIAAYTQNLLHTIQPLCIEHYRDLTKHARRKKTKGTPASSATTLLESSSQVLSSSAWNVRYEIKQGVFAEFRQEMDVAERHYATAVEELLSPEGVLETTPNWSPRWEDARLLCDCIAMRNLRCLLWNDLTTRAALFWCGYKTRMNDFVDRRGLGTQTYSWDAWETRWAEIMAQLIERASIPAFLPAQNSDNTIDRIAHEPFAPAEKGTVATDRSIPFNFLHHAGYWHRLAARSARARRQRALTIPEEHRVPPGRSPASAVAKRTASYDFYLVPDPHEESPLDDCIGYDHLAEILRHNENAIRRFAESGQSRMAGLTILDLARELVDSNRHEDAFKRLLPLWNHNSWRTEHWQDLLSSLLQLLYLCASQLNRRETIVGVTYEMLSVPRTEDDSPVDFMKLLDASPQNAGQTDMGQIDLKFHDDERNCPIDANIVFDNNEVCVGEAMRCQLKLLSRAVNNSMPLTLSSISLHLSQSARITLFSTIEANKSDEEMSFTNIEELIDTAQDSVDVGTCLSLRPGQQRIISLHLVFREPKMIHVDKLAMSIENASFRIQHVFTHDSRIFGDSIYELQDNTLRRRWIPQQERTALTVLPKPPKVQLHVNGVRKNFYTHELVRLEVGISNGEIDAILSSLRAYVRDSEADTLKLSWSESEDVSDIRSVEGQTTTTVSKMLPGEFRTLQLLVQAPTGPATIGITIEAEYALASDSATLLNKNLKLDAEFVALFEPKFNFVPLFCPDPWPSYFDTRNIGSKEQPGGIPQLWRLTCQARSLATESIFVHDVDLQIKHVSGECLVEVQPQDDLEPQTFALDQSARRCFQVKTTKFSLDDRRPTGIDSTLIIQWSHEENGERMSTTVRVPHLTIPSAEPRVFCTLSNDIPQRCDAVLHYYIENPSSHFLTFALTMEANETYAFSGPKHRNLSLAPISRYRSEYRVSLYDKQRMVSSKQEVGCWIWPGLQVVDSFYNKQLRVNPGGTGVKVDDKGNVGVWVAFG